MIAPQEFPQCSFHMHHLTHKNKLIFVLMIFSQIIYKMEYNRNKATAYTLGHDTPLQLHMKKVKDLPSVVRRLIHCSCKPSLRTTAKS